MVGRPVEETERRLVHAGVRVGSARTMDVDPFDWDYSRRSVWREYRINAYVAV